MVHCSFQIRVIYYLMLEFLCLGILLYSMFKYQRYCRVSFSVFQSVMSSTPVKVKGGISYRPTIGLNQEQGQGTPTKEPRQRFQVLLKSRSSSLCSGHTHDPAGQP